MPHGLSRLNISDTWDKDDELEIELDEGETLLWLSVSEVEALIEILKQRLLAREAQRA